MPLYIFNKEKASDYKILCTQGLEKNNIPIIIIDDKEYNNFIKILEHFKNYEKFKNITILKEKFIISNKIFNKPNHININNEKLFAECNSFSQIYNEREYKKYESDIKKNLPKDLNLSNFFEEWVIILFNILTEYILFILRKQPLYFPCNKCNSPNLYIKCTKTDDENNRHNLINKVENEEANEEKKNIILNNMSLGIANLLIDYMDFNKLNIIKYNNIINKIFNQQNNNYHRNNNISLGNPPKKGNDMLKEKGENINVIYYDEDNKKKRAVPNNIYIDSNLFERVIPNGSFILVTDEMRLNLVLEEIKKNNNNNSVEFNLIISGSNCKKIMEKLSDKNIFKNGCIYTTNLIKYKNLKEKYDIINLIYTEEDEIISFINDNKSYTEIFKTYKLINYNNYIDNYYYFHKLIYDQYNPETLENGNIYEYSVAILQDINSNTDLDIETLSAYLQMIKNQNEDIRKNIVKEYTSDGLYKYFNRWLNELDFLAYQKISYFVALLMYGINDYNNEQKGLKENKKLYRGLTMTYINLSF